MPSANDPAGAEPSTGEVGHGALEMKTADYACMEDMEASTAANPLSAYSQDTVEVYAPEEEVQNLD